MLPKYMVWTASVIKVSADWQNWLHTRIRLKAEGIPLPLANLYVVLHTGTYLLLHHYMSERITSYIFPYIMHL